MADEVQNLAAYRNLVQRGEERWASFLQRRQQQLAEWERNQRVAEKVAENILRDLFTEVLDWGLGDMNHQVERADIVITHRGLKRLVVETKQPGLLRWTQLAVADALDQARGYADSQRVKTIAVSDEAMIYAADIENGGPRPRLYVSLVQSAFPADLWWISRDGIYRSRGEFSLTMPALEHEQPDWGPESVGPAAVGLLHRKYLIPARCFAYVGDANKTSTWKLPYRHADNNVDEKRLPKAIQCLLTNYRGAHVDGIPEAAVPDTLRRLEQAARALGRMPDQNPGTADIYHQLAEALRTFGKSASGT